jgi:hypothetical protein
MELNKEKKMKSEQAVLPNLCLEEEEEDRTRFNEAKDLTVLSIKKKMFLSFRRATYELCHVRYH